MKLREIAEVIKGVHLIEEGTSKKVKAYRELSMLCLEPISFLDERKVINVNSTQKVSVKQITKAGDVIVSLYSPMIACFVEKGQEGYVVPHHMSIIRVNKRSRLDSRFIVHFINSARGRRALANSAKDFSSARPTSLPFIMLNEIELLAGTNNLIERF